MRKPVDTYPREPWLSAAMGFFLGPLGLLYTSNLLALLGFVVVLCSASLLFSSLLFKLLLAAVFGLAGYLWATRRPDLSRFPTLQRFDPPTWAKALGLGASLLLFAFGFTRFIAAYVSTTGLPMVPTIMAGERVRVNLLPSQRSQLARGVVVLYQVPEQNQHAISRVVALAGDKVEMRRGLLYVNGQAADDAARIQLLKEAGCLNEALPMNSETAPDSTGPFVVPAQSVYLLADNRAENFMDSRFFGPVPLSEIVGVIPAGRGSRSQLAHADCQHDLP